MLADDSRSSIPPTPAEASPAPSSARPSSDLANVCFYLFILGGAVGVAQLSNPLPFGAGFEMVAIGKNLAETGTFANPFLFQKTGPTAVNPPLYPLLLSLLFQLFGPQGLVVIFAAIGNVTMNALTASWLPRVSMAIFGSAVPGVAGAILWLGGVQLMPAWDTGYTAAGLTLFYWYSVSALESTRPIRGAVLSGVLAAAVVMLNPSGLIVLLPWLAYLITLPAMKKMRKRALLFVAIVLSVVCVPAGLWMLRNALVLGAPVLRTNLGMTLFVSNNECAQPSLLESALNGCYQSHHPNDSVDEARTLLAEGEINYDKNRVAASINWIRSNPSRFRQLTMQRLWQFWFPPPIRPVLPIYVVWLGTVLSIPGFVLMVWRRKLSALFIGSVLFFYPLMYYVVVTDVRYRYPILWLTFLLAGYFIHIVLSRAARWGAVIPLAVRIPWALCQLVKCLMIGVRKRVVSQFVEVPKLKFQTAAQSR